MEGKTIVGFTILSKCEWDKGRAQPFILAI